MLIVLLASLNYNSIVSTLLKLWHHILVFSRNEKVYWEGVVWEEFVLTPTVLVLTSK